MLRTLTLKHVGPAEELDLKPVAERSNLITGDNGLGKTFLLEVGSWALMRIWNGIPAVPTEQGASIALCELLQHIRPDDMALWER